MCRKKRAVILTLGCKVNQYESEAFAEMLRRSGIEAAFAESDDSTDEPKPDGSNYESKCGGSNDESEYGVGTAELKSDINTDESKSDIINGESRFVGNTDKSDADICIINTCSVTAEADRKSRQLVRRMIKEHPGASVYVTGCAAQAAPEIFSSIPGVCGVIGNAKKTDAVSLAITIDKHEKSEKAPVCSCDLGTAEFEDMSITGFRRARAYIKIEDGCESKCAYCIIPSVRGKIRSKPRDAVLKEAAALTAGGCPELVLTGIETSAYQFGLASLIEETDRIPGLKRLRLGSLDPSIMRPEFTDSYAACRHTMPHFHLSMQSGCDRTLASMRRKYNTDSVRKKLEYIRKTIPDAEFSGDVICGFPGESEKDFEETVKFFRETEFLFLHIFPYSIRPGTEAASMPNQLPRNIIRERTAALADIQRKITEKRLNKMINEEKPLDVLIETVSRTGNTAVLSGHSPQFAEVKIPVSASILHTLCEKENSRENIVRVFPELMENQVIIASLMSNKSSNY